MTRSCNAAGRRWWIAERLLEQKNGLALNEPVVRDQRHRKQGKPDLRASRSLCCGLAVLICEGEYGRSQRRRSTLRLFLEVREVEVLSAIDSTGTEHGRANRLY